MAEPINPFGVRSTLSVVQSGATLTYYSLPTLATEGRVDVSRLPFTVKILLESLLRQVDGINVSEDDVLALAQRRPGGGEFPFLPYRVVLQDFTGVPCVVDLAAMRSAVARMGGDPQRINPLSPADLVIDHSVQVDEFATPQAFAANVAYEYERNRERYGLLRWAQAALQNCRVVPPGTGIVHQVNLEYLASVVATLTKDGETIALPDTLVGTDSHTTMINGLGVLGWGVGGIEAEAVLLGQPMYQLPPIVVGMRLEGSLPEGATATDLVLTVTQMLRRHGVVGKFVEFSGPGLSGLALADRATISNMAPEYGATAGLFPVDDETLRYLTLTGRDPAQVALVEAYCKAQGLFRTDDLPDPVYDETLSLDLATVVPSLAGPRRPQDRVAMGEVGRSFRAAYPDDVARDERVPVQTPRGMSEVTNGSVAIAAITSCTNTSNPMVMIGAGLVAKKAVERGLVVKPHVKTSLAPGSRAVTAYLENAGLQPYLDELGFNLVGYGCTTCIGNSGPLPDAVDSAIGEHNLVVAAVLSGNRNFEGRIHARVKASYLASPPLVVSYALAGTVDIDLTADPLGVDMNGTAVYLKDIWPTQAELREAVGAAVTPEVFRKTYAVVFEGDEAWRSMPVPTGALYEWDEDSTYIQEPPYFAGMTKDLTPLSDIIGARALAILGDSVTTDHISPAGSIAKDSPAGAFLIQKEVPPSDFNSYGARRGNHQVMMRGTFANIRLRNALTPDREGNWTVHLPSGEVMSIYDAAMRYAQAEIPLIIIGGKEYGTGSSRDWAAKGTMLLGARAVLVESYERIHRSNLVGMGVLPLEFLPGDSASSLGLTGRETFDITGIADGVTPRDQMTVRAVRENGSELTFNVLCRIDSNMEVEYYRHGGILQYVLRGLM